MKKTYLAILGLVATLTLTSCSDDFLEKSPKNTVDPETEITDDVAVAMANACYRTLQSSNMYNQRLWTLDIVAGNSIVGAGGGTDGLETIQASNFTTLSDNGMALYMWRSPWVGIGQCNILINGIETTGYEKGSIKERCLGEALFLRSHYYYVLVRLYGGVPLRLKPFTPGESTDIARSSVDDVYTQILTDCQRAAEILPAKADYNDDEKGRAQVEQLGYDLSKCSYTDNFDARINNGPESIFEVQYSGNTEYDFWGNNPQSSWLSTFMGPRNSDFVAGSYGWNQPTEEFVGQYEDGDLRKDWTILYEGCPDFDGMTYKGSYSNTGYNVRKFLVPKSVSPEYNTCAQNFVVWRFADVLLMKAEALNEQGKTAEATAPLNTVRRRAGLPNVAGLSQDEMREKIIHERRIELAFEGHRWFDMIRIDGGNYALNFLHRIGKTRATKERLLFPIPQTEMDANTLMTQNPGY